MPIANGESIDLSFFPKVNRQLAFEIENDLNSTTLGWPATVVWNGCSIANRNYSNSSIGNCPNRRLAAPAGSFNSNFTLLHTGLVRFFCRLVGRLLRSEGRSLTRASESARAS